MARPSRLVSPPHRSPHTLPSHTLSEARVIAARVQSLVDSGAIESACDLARDELVRALDEPRALLLHAHAMSLVAAGRLVEALRAAAASLEGFRNAGSRSGELDALLAIASVMRAAGDHDAAIQTLEDAEVIARELDDAVGIGRVLRTVGICCSIIGRHQQAISSLAEAAALHAAQPGQRDHLATLQSLYNAHGRYAVSLPADSAERSENLDRHLDRWIALAHDAARAGMTRTELMALGNHAITLHDAGRHREGLEGLAALLPRYREHAMAPNEAICHFEMGRAHESLAEHAWARFHYSEAVEQFERTGASGELRDALEGLANVEEAIGDHRAALQALRRARAIASQLDEAAAHRSAEQRELRIELARLSSQWHRLASIDPLTGLANRRALEQWFAESQPRIEAGEPVMVLLHDLDHFKSINDRFGHQVGDEVLRQVAQLIQVNCRPHDLAVRYGGEEFLLAMCNVDHQSAVDVAERLRASVESHRWATIASDLAVTISVGIAGVEETGDTKVLLTLADRRLYAAKHGGRNRVVATN